MRLQGEARVCETWGLGQSRNGKYQQFMTCEVWYPALSVLLVLLLHLLLHRLLNLDQRELKAAKSTRAAAIVGADRFESLASGQ